MAQQTSAPAVVAIAGRDTVQIEEELSRVLTDAGIDLTDGFDHAELDGIDADASAIVQAATTIPFLSAKRSVVVRRADRLRDSDVEQIAAMLPNVPKTSLLVFVFEPLDDGAKGVALKNAAKKVGQLIEIRPPDRAKVIADLKDRAKREGIAFEPKAAEHLADLVSDDLSEAVSELSKLLSACRSKGAVSIADVNEIVIPSREYRVFVLLDEVCSGRLGPALAQLDRLISSAATVEQAAMRNVLPQMHKQLLLIYQARAIADARTPLTSPEAEMSLNTKYSLAAQKDFSRSKATSFARRLTLRQVARLLRLVLETDMRLKGQLAQASPRETVERMLAEMCMVAAPQA
ncbi:MAG: DNA polymerase III subunit delta [Fimbriimonadales bacterium]|nr:DNA polymerase III subunit delta [Fimbriimonadales bacterium]